MFFQCMFKVQHRKFLMFWSLENSKVKFFHFLGLQYLVSYKLVSYKKIRVWDIFMEQKFLVPTSNIILKISAAETAYKYLPKLNKCPCACDWTFQSYVHKLPPRYRIQNQLICLLTEWGIHNRKPSPLRIKYCDFSVHSHLIVLFLKINIDT